jgi:hypothetical protein
MEHQSCQIGAGAYCRVGSFDAVYAADFYQESHGAGLMDAPSFEIKQGMRLGNSFHAV